MSTFIRRTWVEIDLDALAHNYQTIRNAIAPNCKIMSVVKADAYGHGASHIAPALQKLGSDWFAVSNIEEAIQLRKHHITRPILILGFTPIENADLLAKYSITQAIYSSSYAEKLNDMARKYQVTIQGHLKIDTGMTRIGFMYQDPQRDAESLDDMEQACRLTNLHIDGVFTHFAVADEKQEGKEYTQKQYHNFTDAIAQLEQRGVHFSLRHCCNSGAIMDYPEMNLDMVRPGIILYGLWPSSKLAKQLDLRPVMSLKSVISLMKKIQSDTSVSYGRIYTADSTVTAATIPIGYADGYPRAFSNRADMLIHSKRAPIIGRVCMDQLMLDVSDIPDAKEGDTVTVFGRDGDSVISIDELCSIASTINYELICIISKRVPRIFYQNGQQVGQQDYICTEDDIQ